MQTGTKKITSAKKAPTAQIAFVLFVFGGVMSCGVIGRADFTGNMSYYHRRTAMSKTSARHVILSGQDLTFKNTNLLITPGSPFYFEGAFGMKTGYNEQAGHCIIAAAQKNGTEIIAVAMGAQSSDFR